MASVASQIRIDLLANAASFNGVMQSGGASARSFADECEKVDRKLAKLHATEDYAKRQQAAWQSAMTGSPLRSESPLHQRDGYQELLDAGLTVSQKNHQRWDALLRRQKDESPWGQSVQTTLSRDALRLAGVIRGHGAAIGNEMVAVEATISSKSKLLQRTITSIFGRGAARPLRAFGNISELLGGFSSLTTGIAAVGVAALVATNRAIAMGEAINKTREEAVKAGMAYDEYVKKQGLEQHSRFIEGSALTADAVKNGGGFGGGLYNVVAHPLNSLGSAFTGLYGGAVNLADVTASAGQWAAGGGWQYGGVGSQAEYARIEDEQKRHTIERNAQSKEQFATLDVLQHKINEVGKTSEEIARDDYIAKVKPDVGQLAAYDELADKLKKINTELALKNINKDLDRMGMTPEQKELEAFKDKLDAHGIKDAPDLQGGSTADKRYYKEHYQPRSMAVERFQKQQQDKADDDALKSLTKKTAEDTYNEGVNKAEGLFQHKKINAEQLFSIERRLLQDYYKEAEQLDAEAIRKRLRSGHEEYQRDLANLRAHGRDVGLTPDEINRETGRRSDEERKRLGVSNPLGDFAKDMEEHRKALSDGTITQKEFNDWRTKRQKSAVSEMVGETPSIRLNGAMAAGSAEAHSLIAQASTSDPRTKAAIDAVNVLNRIAAVLESGKAVNDQMLRALNEAII